MTALPVVAASSVIAFVLLGAMWGRPRFALVVWLFSMVMVPSWVGISALPVQSAVALLVILAIGGSLGIKLDWYDCYFSLFLILAFLTVFLGGDGPIGRTLLIEFIVKWALPYLVARVVLPASGLRFGTDAVAVAFTGLGMFAICEFVLGFHPYTKFMTGAPGYETWGSIQIRDGLERSEWAFGHSIALGGSLALAVPFVLASSFDRRFKAMMIVFVFGGVACTLSRGALIAAGLTLLLCALAYLSMRGLRFAMLTVGFAATVLAVVGPDQLMQFAFGTTAETQESATYRERLYETLMPALVPFGNSDYTPVSTGASIDSAFLYVGMHFGWVILFMLVLPLLVVVVRILRGRASNIEAGLLGQVPLLATVSLITQYQSLLFFVVGFAVQAAAMKNANDERNIRHRPAVDGASMIHSAKVF